jgi:hypothetical protein
MDGTSSSRAIAEGKSWGRGMFSRDCELLDSWPVSAQILVRVPKGIPLPPRRTTGLSLSRKNSSISELSSLVVLLFLPVTDLMAPLALLSALEERLNGLVVPLLRPRNAKRPYFSCPVPATGPFIASRFGFSTDFSELDFDFRDMKLNRGDLLGGAGGIV